MTSLSVAFIDFEASSLSEDSYPIEVGWAVLHGGSGSTLIRPSEGWTDWDEASERIHRLSRETIERDGTPAADVAREFIANFGQQTLISDSPDFDGPWLTRLLAEGGHDAPLPVTDYWQAMTSGVSAILENRSELVAPYVVREATYKALEYGRRAMREDRQPRHRAEMDAVRLRLGYEAAMAEARTIAECWKA